MNLRDIRKRLRAYFGQVRNCIRFVRAKGMVIIDIEYEDFRSEQVVECEVRHIVGSGFLLNVKRECSPQLMEQIYQFLAYDTDGRKTFFKILQTFEPEPLYK